MQVGDRQHLRHFRVRTRLPLRAFRSFDRFALSFDRPSFATGSRSSETGRDKRRTRPGHRAQPLSPGTELTDAGKRRTRGGQGLGTEPSHRIPATELTEFRGAAKRRTTGGRGQEEDKRRTRPGHRAQPQS